MNRIAIVEDDQGYRDTLFTYIKQYEQERDTAFEATPFEKADDFLAVYNGDYDIILMDIEMPGTNGMDAAEQIRKKDAQVVIMFITNMAHYAIKGYEVGALDFVLKPIQYLNFANKMDRAMQLVENLKKTEPELVADVIPNVISYANLEKILRSLLREGIPIRDLAAILEAVVEAKRRVWYRVMRRRRKNRPKTRRRP